MANLPLNFKSTGGSNNLGRAQIFSVSKLNQKKDRENAKVSMDQVVRGEDNKPTTSINRVGGGDTVTTSVNRPGSTRGVGGGDLDQSADERRYDYIRRLVRQRQAKERKEQDKKTP